LAVIRLTLQDARESSSLEMSAFRVTGAAVSSLELGLIAYLAHDRWWHTCRPYSTLSFTGRCRLLFGISRDPDLLSEPFQRLDIRGTNLHADGARFAQYSKRYDMWCGVQRPMLWTAMLAVSDALTTAFVDERRIELVSPRQPAISQQRASLSPPGSQRPS
jgi:hypothetical protein